MLYIAFVCIFLSIFLFTYNKNHLSKKKFTYVFIQLLTYVIHLYVSTNYTIIITIVLTLQLLIYVIHLYVSINYYVHVRKCLLF